MPVWLLVLVVFAGLQVVAVGLLVRASRGRRRRGEAAPGVFEGFHPLARSWTELEREAVERGEPVVLTAELIVAAEFARTITEN